MYLHVRTTSLSWREQDIHKYRQTHRTIDRQTDREGERRTRWRWMRRIPSSETKEQRKVSDVLSSTYNDIPCPSAASLSGHLPLLLLLLFLLFLLLLLLSVDASTLRP